MKHRIKIAYFIDRLIMGGTELQLVEQINRLEKKGVVQELFCLYRSKEQDSISVNCKVNILDITSLVSINCIIKIFKVRKYLISNGFNIVQTYFFDSTIVGITVARLSGIRKSINCRRDMGFWYTPKLLFVLRVFNALTSRILVNCHAVARNVVLKEKQTPEKIDILYNGIDTGCYKLNSENRIKARHLFGIKEDEIAVGIIANMSRYVKRVDVFVDSAKYVIERNEKAKFFILGNGYLKGDLVLRVKKFGMEHQIIFPDARSSKNDFLSAMDIGALSSDSEGFSNSILEYMAIGLPVVATNVGGNPEIINNEVTGYLTTAGDPVGFAEKIICLIEDHDKRHTMGTRAKEAVKDYDWEFVANRIYRYYEIMSKP